jgi:anti-sigma regulatory factor (Ser/Thr protein kinase)
MGPASGEERSWSRELPAGPDTASEARWFLLEALREREEPLDLATAALLTTEVASNAARYGREPIELSIDLEEESLRVSVFDHGAGFDPGGIQSGLGIKLVDRLSTDWGADRTDDGIDVWFRL